MMPGNGHFQRNKRCPKYSIHSLICFPLVVSVVIYVIYHTMLRPQAVTNPLLVTMTSWAKNNDALPESLLKSSKEITVNEHMFDTQFEGHSIAVNYKEVLPTDGPAKLDLLLLHGASFSSQTWKDIGTLQLISALGHRAVAIDLPGFGKSPSATIKDTGAFIFHLIGELKLSKPVFICASMSGRYALPSVLKPKSGTCENNFRGFIPIAPVGTSSYTSEDYVQCKVPTMIVYGERDRGAPVDTLSQMPNSAVRMMKNAGHACYMDDTSEWHRLLYNFLKGIGE